MRKSESRAAAKAAGEIKYRGAKCRHGHDGMRFVSSKGCCSCAKIKQVTPERRAYMSGWRTANREHCRAYLKNWKADRSRSRMDKTQLSESLDTAFESPRDLQHG